MRTSFKLSWSSYNSTPSNMLCDLIKFSPSYQFENKISLVHLLHYWSYPVMFNSSPPRQNGRHFRSRHFQMHFHERRVLYFHSNFIRVCPIDKVSALVQVMARDRTGVKPLPEPMRIYFTDTYMQQWGRWITAIQELIHHSNIKASLPM